MPDNITVLKKKIFIIGPAHPLRGGLASFNERLAREYQNSGFDVEIISYKLQYPSIFFPGKTQYSNEPPPQNLKIITLINSINPLNWYRVGQKLKKASPDLLIIRYWIPFMAPCLGFISHIVKKNGKTKIIAVVDNLIPHEKRPFDSILSKFFIKSVHGFITMSKTVLNDLSAFDKVKPRRYCPHPLYDNFGLPILKKNAQFTLGLPSDFHYVLFFGFIRDYKGLDLLIQAFSDDRIRNQQVKLLVAGEFYSKPEPYLSLINDLGVSDKIVLSNDFIPDSNVRDYFCAADLVVQPYKHATQSGVTQIAYHFNKPMIVTDVGGLAEMIPHNKVGYVVKPDSKSIADAIVNFFQNNEEEKFSKNVEVEKQKYSWHSFTESIGLLFSEISKNSSY